MIKSTSLTLFFLSAVVSHGAQLLTFDFQGNTGSETTAASNSNLPGILSSTISRGTGVTAGANTNSFNASDWSTGALDANDYFQFTVAAAPGFQFNLTDLGIPEQQRSSTGPVNFSLRSDLDGYSNDIATFSILDVTTQQSGTFDFVDIINKTSVTFRIYGYSAEGASGTWRLGPGAGNDLIVNGSVVPEPASAILALFGLGVFLRRRR